MTAHREAATTIPETTSATSVAADTMTAIVHESYGTTAADVLHLQQVARPAIGDDEVLVRVHAASVDRGTWHIMAGLPYPVRLAGFGVRRPRYANPGRAAELKPR